MRGASRGFGFVLAVAAGLYGAAYAQQRTPAGVPEIQLANRISVAGGMGVSYLNAQDLIDHINTVVAVSQRVPDFKAAVDFFGQVTVPLSPDWLLRLEYAYLMGSFNAATSFGTPGEFGFAVHMPSVMLRYVLVDGGTYDLQVGIGGGYHAGAYTERYFSVDDRYTGSGIGTCIDLDAHTAFGENLFGYLGGNVRWEFVGNLRNGLGRPPGGGGTRGETTLQFFSLGARLGFSYYF